MTGLFYKTVLAVAVLTLIIVGTWGCLEPVEEFSAIPPGVWRATLNLASGGFTDDAFDETTSGMLPFNFDVVYDTKDSFHIEILNGEERIVVDDIEFGFDRAQGKDTIRIELPVFNTYIRARYEEDAIEGDWYAPDRSRDYSIPFRAYHGKNFRFNLVDPPLVDFSGKWAVTFKPGKEDAYQAVGDFSQDESGIVTGTFITNTGDYRFLEGRASGNRLFLSVFDGSHAYLFEAKYLDDGSLAGIYRSGNHYKVYWTAVREGVANILVDPYGMNTPPPLQTIDFAFPNVEGDTISLSDSRYEGKVKVIQIMGTWCPNCRDETEFLLDFRKTHPDLEFETIALAFERQKDLTLAYEGLRKFSDYYALDYEVLYAGTNSKSEATEKLGFLDGVKAFPTLLFVDRNNILVKVHTGFQGPATDGYDEFREEFKAIIQNLLTAQ